MHVPRTPRAVVAVLALAAAGLGVASPAPAAVRTTTAAAAQPATRFYVPPPNPDGVRQVADLVHAGRLRDAALVGRMITTPQAVWFDEGTPAQVRRSARAVVTAAAHRRAVPVLVAYNLPYRDCSQYSAGGARDTAAYLRWIDGLARGIGRREAVVLLEPDGLGIIPFNTTLAGEQEWCRPTDDQGRPLPGASPEDRYRALTGAVARLAALPRVRVYLDGTHSAWLGVGEIASRLARAHVHRTRGFFLNVSNYETTERQLRYGTWISQCLAYAAPAARGGVDPGGYASCASQYSPANPADLSTWGLTDAWYAEHLKGAVPRAHFVIDTSRNGRGPWTAPADHPAGDPQTWCNPPDRGLGLRPTTRTGNPLADAFLWIKVPGESDGQCYRWTTGPTDPVRGTVDPPAGVWFPQMALELARNANPPLLRR
jgi:endoglucanase